MVKSLATLVILSRISSGGMKPSKESAMSPNKNTKDGSPRPHKMEDVIPPTNINLSCRSARVHTSLLKGTIGLFFPSLSSWILMSTFWMSLLMSDFLSTLFGVKLGTSSINYLCFSFFASSVWLIIVCLSFPAIAVLNCLSSLWI